MMGTNPWQHWLASLIASIYLHHEVGHGARFRSVGYLQRHNRLDFSTTRGYNSAVATDYLNPAHRDAVADFPEQFMSILTVALLSGS